jgi:chemotaxis protein MotB
MRKVTILLVISILILPLLVGCSSKAKDERIASLESQVADLQSELEQARQAREQAEQRAQELQSDLDSLANKLQIEMEQQDKNILLRIPDKLLFASGSATIRQGGKDMLGEVSNVIGNYPDYDIRVEGHTDNEQILPQFQDRFRSNWELSTARATNVVHYMINQQNVDPDRISAVGYGEYRPIATNETADGRAQNRRVEIYFVPKYEVKPISEAEQSQQEPPL